jgi:DNA-binding HxlR family transcriptional regulator
MSSIKKAPSGNATRTQNRPQNQPQSEPQPRASRPNPVTGCPLTAALSAIGGKWKLIIVYWLAESPKHFAALRREMPGISPKVLTEQLRELMSDGMVHREPRGAIPAPVVYSLTDYGRTVLPLVEDVRLWGRAHLESLNGEK